MEDNTLTTIGAVAIVAVVGAGLILNQQGDPAPQVDQAKTEQPQTETYFAQVDKDGTVLQVIVADQEFINSGAVGDPSSWVQTFKDGGTRAKSAPTLVTTCTTDFRQSTSQWGANVSLGRTAIGQSDELQVLYTKIGWANYVF